jgi:hypothetical protein
VRVLGGVFIPYKAWELVGEGEIYVHSSCSDLEIRMSWPGDRRCESTSDGYMGGREGFGTILNF